MSVNNVNSMYQTQGVQNGSAYTYQASDNSESGVDIGKLLLGAGAAIAIGVTTCAAAKKGKTVSGDNGFFTNVVNGVKSWFGKNTDDVAKSATKGLSSEETNTLKRLIAGDESLSQTDIDNLYKKAGTIADNIDNTKVKNNAEKLDAVNNLLKHTSTTKENVQEQVNSLNRLFSNSLKKDIFEVDGDKIKIKGDLSAQDLAIVRGKLGKELTDIDGNINLSNLNAQLSELKKKYTEKHTNYQEFAKGLNMTLNSTDFKELLSKTCEKFNGNIVSTKIDEHSIEYIAYTPVENTTTNMKHFLNRNTALADLSDSNFKIETTDDYLRQLAKLDKYKTNGTITTEQYDNARGVLFNKLKGMSSSDEKTNYLKLLCRDLKDDSGNTIKIDDITRMDEKTLKAFNGKYGTEFEIASGLEFNLTDKFDDIIDKQVEKEGNLYLSLGLKNKNISQFNSEANVYNTTFNSNFFEVKNGNTTTKISNVGQYDDAYRTTSST